MTTKILSAIAAAAVLFSLASCNRDRSLDPLAGGPVPMSFLADISNVATRATATGFEADDAAGIIPMKNGTVETAQANIAYTCDGTNFTANPPYWFQDLDKVTFNAYYPYDRNLAADHVIDIDTRAANQTYEIINGHVWYKNDYLFASAETDVRTPQVAFTGSSAFQHVMSSISIKFRAGTDDGIENLDNLTGYTIGQLVVDGSFDCSTGAVTLDGSAAAESITIDGISCALSTTLFGTEPLIVLPQTVSGGKFSLTVNYNGSNYVASLTLAELAAGTRYEFPVTIKNTGLEIGNADIKDWATGTATGGDAVLQ